MSDHLWRAYARTWVEFVDVDGSVWAIEPVIRDADDTGPAVEGWREGVAAMCLAEVATAWVLTGHNPGSAPLPPSQNRQRHLDLAAAVAEAGHRGHEAVGRAMEGDWSEDSLLVCGAPEDLVLDLARRFDQNAVYRWTPTSWSIIGVHLAGSRHGGWRGFPLG
ncbi:MAG: DUF3293 domain-containing protein [Candidatus Nanopelagicales bacterium]